MKRLFTYFLLGFSLLFCNNLSGQESTWRWKLDQSPYHFNTARTPFIVLPNVIQGGSFQVAGGLRMDDMTYVNRWGSQLDVRAGLGSRWEVGASGAMGQYFMDGQFSPVTMERLAASVKWQVLDQVGTRPNILLEALSGVNTPNGVEGVLNTLGSSLRAAVGWRIGQKNEVITNGRIYSQWSQNSSEWEAGLAYRRWFCPSFGTMASFSAGNLIHYPDGMSSFAQFPEVGSGFKGGIGFFGKLAPGLHWDASGSYNGANLFITRYSLATGLTWDFGMRRKVNLPRDHGNHSNGI